MNEYVIFTTSGEHIQIRADLVVGLEFKVFVEKNEEGDNIYRTIAAFIPENMCGWMLKEPVNE